MKPGVFGIDKSGNFLLQQLREAFYLVTQTRWRIIWLLLLAALLLSGCVRYDVGIQFDSQTHGQIVQHIKLQEKLTAFSNETGDAWLASIEKRSRELQGKTKRISPQEITVTIPFNNGKELEEKFNQFFNPVERKKSAPSLAEDLPEIKSEMRVKQNNLILVLRNRISYDLDLRSLGVISANGNVLLSPGAILELDFALNTPWGAKSINTAPGAIIPARYLDGHQLVWTLQAGQLNHVEAIFWVPSPIGIGAVAIALLIAAGGFLRYKILPPPILIQRQTPAGNESI